ncbi:alpha/beta fold hydrolase [Runella salmonicolor]|uniref:Alpha/beta hydrolase n=1 Tax=Runella salmonicolor TaxID=2950278 RepID=A0ABT1FPF6_9BACT|nr:alpha/beta hydrolase [Runella salmonicolor]MCP1383649.1 alpha/beta hydrolase [Runella salmonicolor]
MRLHYQTYGEGPRPLLAFHGIGQDHRCFLPLVNVLKKQYTFYLFDLPFHGKSPAMDTEKLSMAEWQDTLEVFLAENHLQTFSIVGFSMGGKFALATLQLFPNQIISCWLLAPDGITESPWYRLATRFWLTKKLFKFVVGNVEHFKKLAYPFQKLGLVEKSAVKFAQSTLATATQRERIYRSWVGFSTIQPDIPAVASIILKYKIDLKLFLGRFDAVLPASYVQPLMKRLPNSAPIILKTGHHRLIEKVAEWFV